ncbi:tRNA (adenosine(37)-N6)-threonylcarbamoyltransferase complex ATPase subunit type 1 TsaE [Rhizobium halophytocola]|uniref:tRNA threonylcarbamoyladenosine biosynthesis protein TsaE n=1 Tax=Rhizobium halophytocola TaxID=735519 RepID=A0ABS4E1K9_9HYPH|nr:tRNA (adenosine(37)-N6)-threonylcarbamoyltransferase complex ATPase subunit type 1 TsaE [Rhizobium halophytocola]MBP1851825.1 tRNA threonylcarbamoyl adenosine modification protein YjeE [Rhizobium halophytocola]
MSDAATSLSLYLEDDAATARFGEDLALALKPGDCVTLSGDLGAGKSTLARALIRAVADDPGLEVPSPTFTLVQVYDLRLPIAHFDLYRLGHASELDELGLEEILDGGIALIEWPERAVDDLPAERLALAFGFEGPGRRIEISGPAARLARLERVLAIRRFLDDHGYAGAARRFLIGDASTRAYERIHTVDGRSLVLMDAPRRPNGPPIRDGKPYSQLVHLAEDVAPFVAVDNLLGAQGFAVPAIHAADLEAGLLVLEDLGQEGVLDADGDPVAERYEAAVECLAEMHGRTFDPQVTLATGHVHTVPPFDRAALTFETSLLLDWYLPWRRDGALATDSEQQDYADIWNALYDELQGAEQGLLLRDFHSPNIIWRPQEAGIRRIGLIDFQDALIGPLAYDVVSIVQDARVTIPSPLADRLMQRYLALRAEQGDFDCENFLKAWHIMAAQRACKLNGLWVRLLRRDGKPNYMKHMPRTLWYLSTALSHPALAPLRDWCAKAGIGATESTR